MAALTVRICGIKIYRIALVEDYLLVLENNGDAALQHEVELLTRMSNELCGLVRGLKSNEKGLHDLVRIAEGKILEAVAGEAAHALAVTAADDLICIYTAGLTCDQLVEIEKVKTDIELIFNGKLLNPEDLEFKNIKNAQIRY